MATITPIGERQLRRQSAGGPRFDIDAVVADDLVAATDDHTRELIARHPRSRRGRLIMRMLIGADVVGVGLAFLAVGLLWRGNESVTAQDLKLFALSVPCWILVARLHGLYRRDEERADHCTTDDIVGVFHVVTICAWLLLIASRLVGFGGPGVLKSRRFGCLLGACASGTLGRATRLQASRRLRAEHGDRRRRDIGQLICRKLIKHPEYGANVVGFVDRTPKVRREDLPDHLRFSVALSAYPRSSSACRSSAS